MARYFFNTLDSGQARDVDGLELPDHAAARKHAVKFAGEVMQSEPAILWEARAFEVKVTDENDLLLFTVAAYVKNATGLGTS